LTVVKAAAAAAAYIPQSACATRGRTQTDPVYP